MSSPLAIPAPPDLTELARTGPLALFLDFDGTLVPIAATPDGIAVPPGLNAALHELQQRMAGRLALISGRALNDIEQHLGPVQIARAGSHGIDRVDKSGSALGEQPEGVPDEAVREMKDYVGTGPLYLERKSHGAALHYRGATSDQAAAREFAGNLAQEYGLAVKHGKCVVELVQPGADKGGAVDAFMRIAPFAGAKPVFIGDDVTDEDGFRAADAAGGFGILVGENRATRARYRLDGVAGVYDWLELNP